MAEKPNTPLRRKKLKHIKEKDRALTLFTVANLALMVNTGIAGIIKSLADMQATERQALGLSQMASEICALIVTAIFIVLAIAANRISKAKKHDELTVKAHELKHSHKITQAQEAAIARSSKTIVQIDTSLTLFTAIFACIFIFFGMTSILLQGHGAFTKAGQYQVIGCVAYILAVLLTLLNKVIGDKLQAQIDKDYLGTETAEKTKKGSLLNSITAYLYNLFSFFRQAKGKDNLPLAKRIK